MGVEEEGKYLIALFLFKYLVMHGKLHNCSVKWLLKPAYECAFAGYAIKLQFQALLEAMSVLELAQRLRNVEVEDEAHQQKSQFFM